MTFAAAVRSDLTRYLGAAAGLRGLLRCLALEPAFAALVTLRLVQSGGGRPAKLLHSWMCRRASIHLPAGIDAGPALLLLHPWGLVVGPGVRIGSNVTLFNGVTLGQKAGRYPVIEDDVWIGAHVVVVGGVTIGRGSIIGPGSILVDDVPPGSLVVGHPSRIAREGIEPDVLNRWA